MLAAMRTFELSPADRFTFAQRAAVLSAAYADYFVPLWVNAQQMEAMDQIYDVDARRSVVAHAGREPIGMALLSLRGPRGWISAVGVIPAWRRRGAARAMLRRLLENAAQLGLDEVWLEVIEENAPAAALYRELGFSAARELLTWRYPADGDLLPIPRELLQPAPVERALAHFAAWHGQPPSWQREEPTLRHLAARSSAYELWMEDALAGYCVVGERPDAISILDIGLNPDFGPVKAGRTLLQALAHRFRGRAFTMINVPADDDLSRALAALRFTVTIRQWEMRLPIIAR
ncbi:MAG: ribosomal-protein-alanine N-acetyltransferase [Chloroflexi bacterium ADurb.Bin325]|nr:MAG: ribosomal-protein-alanine N-acetyltransferase [Chloroflexi bacterium ADurb.Bin325]